MSQSFKSTVFGFLAVGFVSVSLSAAEKCVVSATGGQLCENHQVAIQLLPEHGPVLKGGVRRFQMHQSGEKFVLGTVDKIKKDKLVVKVLSGRDHKRRCFGPKYWLGLECYSQYKKKVEKVEIPLAGAIVVRNEAAGIKVGDRVAAMVSDRSTDTFVGGLVSGILDNGTVVIQGKGADEDFALAESLPNAADPISYRRLGVASSKLGNFSKDQMIDCEVNGRRVPAKIWGLYSNGLVFADTQVESKTCAFGILPDGKLLYLGQY
jgi:hypothetical protein